MADISGREEPHVLAAVWHLSGILGTGKLVETRCANRFNGRSICATLERCASVTSLGKSLGKLVWPRLCSVPTQVMGRRRTQQPETAGRKCSVQWAA